MATKIKYQGNLIASITAGQTAEVDCSGLKMKSDLVVEVESGAPAPKTGSLVVTENFVYDHAYEADSVTWGQNSEYDFSLPMDDVTLRVKKVANLVAPEHVNYLISPLFSLTFKLADGSAHTIPLSESGMLAGNGCYISDSFYYGIVWVYDADEANAFIGAPIFENNAVYVSDFFWVTEPEEMAGVELTLVAPSKKLDGISEIDVRAKADPVLQNKEVTITKDMDSPFGVYPDDEYDGLSSVWINPPYIPPTTYMVQSVADLPSDALAGSFAIVLGGE